MVFLFYDLFLFYYFFFFYNLGLLNNYNYFLLFDFFLFLFWWWGLLVCVHASEHRKSSCCSSKTSSSSSSTPSNSQLLSDSWSWSCTSSTSSTAPFGNLAKKRLLCSYCCVLNLVEHNAFTYDMYDWLHLLNDDSISHHWGRTGLIKLVLT